MSHSLTESSRLAETRALPSGLNARDETQFVCPFSVKRSLWVVISHSLIMLRPLDANNLPSALKATAKTDSAPPLSVADTFPVDTSQSSIESSLEPVANFLPSGENATDQIKGFRVL